MWIRELNIKAFGGLKNHREFFNSGFNHLSYVNEFGKTTSVEAIRTALFGFPKIKEYSYLPNDADSLEFSLEVFFSQKNISIHRKNTGERTTAKIIIDGKKNNLPNKPVIPMLVENLAENISFLESELFFIDSDSISEHREFLNSKKDDEVSYLDVINYKGKDIDLIRENLKNKMNSLYTNNKNSNSEYRKNEIEIDNITLMIRKLDLAESENQERYQEYQSIKIDRERVESEISSLNEKLKKAEIISKENDVKIEYLNLLNEKNKNSYGGLKELPLLEDYILLKTETNSLYNEIKKVEMELEELSKLKIDEELEKLCKFSRNCSVPLKEVFKKAIRVDEKRRNLSELKNKLQMTTTRDLDKINPKLLVENLNYYSKEISGISSDNEKTVFLPIYLFSFIGFLCILMSVFAKMEQAFAIPLFGLGILLIIFSGFYFFHDRKKLELKEKSEKEKENTLWGENTFELRKLFRGSELVNSLEIPSRDYYLLIQNDINMIEEYQRLLTEFNIQREELVVFLDSHSEISHLKKLFDDGKMSLFSEYIEKENDILFHIKTKTSLVKKYRSLESKFESFSDNLSRMKSEFISVIGSSEIEDIRNFKNNAEINKERLNVLLKKANSMEIDLKKPLLDIEDLTYLESKINDLVSYRDKLNERIIRLEDRLNNPVILQGEKYSHLNKEELYQLRQNLRKRNDKIREIYNVYFIEDKVIEKMLEILRSKSRPNYIKDADLYFSKIAPESNINIGYDEISNIVFVDSKTGLKQKFENLSAGTQAQVILCLKLAYLSEKDPDNEYPLIIDDALIAYDNNRAERMTELLKFIAEKRQVIYYTARK